MGFEFSVFFAKIIVSGLGIGDDTTDFFSVPKLTSKVFGLILFSKASEVSTLKIVFPSLSISLLACWAKLFTFKF